MPKPYLATRQDDETWTLGPIPIFSSVPKGTKGAPFNVGADWLADTLANLKRRHRTGYFPPVHIHHHGTDKPTFLAGHFEAERVRSYNFGTNKAPAIYVTMKGIPDYCFREIWEGNYPSLSVEIVRYQDREIDSLALLDTEPPFFKFRLLNRNSIEVAEGSPNPDEAAAGIWNNRFGADDECTVSVPAGAFHFCAAEKETTPMKIVLAGNPDTGFTLHGDDGNEIDLSPLGKDVKFSGVELTDGFSFESKDKDNLPKDEAELKKMAKAIAAKLKKLKGSDDDDEDTTPADPDDKGMKGTALSASDAARFDALEAELAEIKAEKKAKSDVETTIKALKGDGYHVSDRTAESIRFHAEKGTLDKYVEDYRRFARKDGPETLGDDEEPDADPVVEKFSAQGEKAHEAAIAANHTFSELVESGLRSDNDTEKERFFNSYMAARGFKPAKAAG